MGEATVAEWLNFFEHGKTRKGVVDAKAPIPERIKRDVEIALAEKMDELKKGQVDEERTEAMLLRIYECEGLDMRIRQLAARKMGELFGGEAITVDYRLKLVPAPVLRRLREQLGAGKGGKGQLQAVK